MQTSIEKTAKNIENYKRKIIFYNSARNGFSEILKYLKEEYENYTLILPAYIGYSPNEGSGIYDPITLNKIEHLFYPIDENINIDINGYEECIKKVKNKLVVLLVHYFGYVDPNIEKAVNYAEEHDAIIIEDCAHALYTDYIDRKCGMFSDVSIYSLHKMLPYADGGMVRINTKKIKLDETDINYNIMEYDLCEIAEKRKKNAEIIENQIKNIKGIKILRPIEQYKNQTPQTYPIIIKSIDKNHIYHALNGEGYGVVSLYHTMIDPLKAEKFRISRKISEKVLNLPVHQDAKEKDLIQMCKKLKEIIGES